MRKLTSLLLAAVLLLSCTVTAFAAEDDPVEIGVYAKTEYSIDGEYTAPVENGSASVTTPDGTVTVANATVGAVTLVVIPMEGDALVWVDGCVDADAVAAYDIHFRDAEGNRINANGAKVSIAVSGTELSVSSVTTSGEDKPLTSEVSGGKVSFTTDGSHYYVICEKDGGELPHEHSYTEVVTKPTCTEKGYTTYTCSCGESFVDDYMDATGHSFTKYESNNDATCKKDGTETAKCDHGCGETDTRTDKGSKLGHKYENGKCIRCGASQWIPETGDTSNIFLWAGLLILSAIALFFLIFWKRRKKDEANS